VKNRATGPWASQETCNRLLGLTDWNRALVLQSVAKRFYQPPLSGQLNNLERRQTLENELKGVRQEMNAAAASQAREAFLEALGHAPDDHYLHEGYAEFLQSVGDLKAATAEWRRVRELLPQDFLSEYQLGRLLAMQGQWEEAESSLRRVVAAHPSMVEAWFELGNVHAGEEKYDQALADYEQVRRRQPQDFRVLYVMGKALAKLKRRPEAMEQFRQAIKLNPNYWDAHFELAGELSFDERIPEASVEGSCSPNKNSSMRLSGNLKKPFVWNPTTRLP
jgi:tetratricopeptide (TPR) repeat protein